MVRAWTKEELINEIKRHDRLYYIVAEPEISDPAYDKMVRAYRKFDPEFEEFQPGLNVPVPKKKLTAKRTMKNRNRKPKMAPGVYLCDRPNHEFVVFDSDDWIVHYWDVYHMADGPHIFKAITSRIQWELDVEKGLLRYEGEV